MRRRARLRRPGRSVGGGARNFGHAVKVRPGTARGPCSREMVGMQLEGWAADEVSAEPDSRRKTPVPTRSDAAPPSAPAIPALGLRAPNASSGRPHRWPLDTQSITGSGEDHLQPHSGGGLRASATAMGSGTSLPAARNRCPQPLPLAPPGRGDLMLFGGNSLVGTGSGQRVLVVEPDPAHNTPTPIIDGSHRLELAFRKLVIRSCRRRRTGRGNPTRGPDLLRDSGAAWRPRQSLDTSRVSPAGVSKHGDYWNPSCRAGSTAS